jgi:hypothetical protein
MLNHAQLGSNMRCAVAMLITLMQPVTLAPQEGVPSVTGHVISGRVDDPYHLRPEGAILMLGRETDSGSFSSTPVPLGANGSFVTGPVNPGTYVLEVIRTPHSVAKPATVVGFTLVRVATADVAGVTVVIRRDTAITGTFRMESDNPTAVWPPHIVVNAFLALDGAPLLADGQGAEGESGGKFVLRNAFGPRVLRCGYTLAPGSWWWPSQVLLDGADVTNVPTDFSAHENGVLEVMFTQHPARIAGTVTDSASVPVPSAWILVSAADRGLRQRWATTSTVAQGDMRGRFSLPVLPGQYVVNAVPPDSFDSWNAAQQAAHLVSGGLAIDVKKRAVTTVTLTLGSR